jgi:hypothetical protein
LKMSIPYLRDGFGRLKAGLGRAIRNSNVLRERQFGRSDSSNGY